MLRFIVAPAVALFPGVAAAAVIPATPDDDVEALISMLEPGDTLQLAAGTYTSLTIGPIAGTLQDWITITGPESGDPAIVRGVPVWLDGPSYVEVKNLNVDLDGACAFGIRTTDTPLHHVLIENNTVYGFATDCGGGNEQQLDGIAIQSEYSYRITIRGNTILEAGTGMYLGLSEGQAPFIGGIIENNLVLNPIGYCAQVKHQNPYNPPDFVDPGPHRTIFRHNVFIKDDRPSPHGARPNLLVSGFPESGPGSEDHYEIYGNFLFHNPNESLFQGAGRMYIHDNVFVDVSGAAMLLTPHQGKDVRLAHIYNNTIFGGARGISINGSLDQGGSIVGNVVLAGDPISTGGLATSDNIVGTVGDGAQYFAEAMMELGTVDVFPRPGQLQGPALDLSAFSANVDYDLDYNGNPKGDASFRGAYAGEGENPGCPLEAELKDCVAGSGGTGGSTGDGSGSSGETSGTTPPGTTDPSGGPDTGGTSGLDSSGTSGATAPFPPEEDDDTGADGCNCRADPGRASAALLLLALVGGLRRRGRPS